MTEREPSLFLPPAIKNGVKKECEGQVQHPLVAACIRPKKNNTAHCQECDITFTQKKFLQQHRIEVHGEKPKWQCKECGMILSSNYILESHMDRHKNSKKHKCPVCPAAFNTRASQKRHFLYKHTEERPHQCSLCDFATVEHDKLVIHLRNHTGESPYVCATCGMTFKTPISYKRHVVTHTGWRQYLCPLCLKKFGTPVTAKQHMFTSHGIFRQMLTPIRNVREHGVPSMLATFLEDVQLGDDESKMVNSLKYYEVQEDALEEIEIVNVDFSIFGKEDGKFTIDKSPFFMLKSKHPVCQRPTVKNGSENMEKRNMSDSGEEIQKKRIRKRRKTGEVKSETVSEISEEMDREQNNAKETAETTAFLTRAQEIADLKEHSQISDKDDTKISENIKATVDENKVIDKIESKKRKRRKSQTKTEAISKSSEKDEAHSLQLADEEAVKILEKLQAEQTQVDVIEPKMKRPRRSKDKTELTNEKAKPENNASADIASDPYKDESSLDIPVFVNLQRKSFSLKTPRLANTVSIAKEDGPNKSKTIDMEQRMDNEQTNPNTAQNELNTVQTTPANPVYVAKEDEPNKSKTVSAAYYEIDMEQIMDKEQTNPNTAQNKLNTVQTTPVEIVENDRVPHELPVYQEEIPYPTQFISVVTEDPSGAKSQVTNINISPIGTSDSNASFQSMDSNISKEGPPKSLPPFISLKGCSPAHQERLLIGMKRGVFGPTPSVVRVLEDGSMINVSNLYKTYLPPAPISQNE